MICFVPMICQKEEDLFLYKSYEIGKINHIFNVGCDKLNLSYMEKLCVNKRFLDFTPIFI